MDKNNEIFLDPEIIINTTPSYPKEDDEEI